MTGPALELRAISKAFGRRPLWRRPVDLTLAATESVALLGPNGSGKSTLLRIAATHLRPTAGTVRVFGHSSREAPEAARRALGFASQDAPVYAQLTPHEQLVWWCRLHDVARDIERMTVEAGLAAVAHRPSSGLSRGQRQRLSLAMAVATDPPLLLLDEPFTALDEAGRHWLEGVLAARRGRSATLMALHDRGDAEMLCERDFHLGGHL